MNEREITLKIQEDKFKSIRKKISEICNLQKCKYKACKSWSETERDDRLRAAILMRALVSGVALNTPMYVGVKSGYEDEFVRLLNHFSKLAEQSVDKMSMPTEDHFTDRFLHTLVRSNPNLIKHAVLDLDPRAVIAGVYVHELMCYLIFYGMRLSPDEGLDVLRKSYLITCPLPDLHRKRAEIEIKSSLHRRRSPTRWQRLDAFDPPFPELLCPHRPDHA